MLRPLFDFATTFAEHFKKMTTEEGLRDELMDVLILLSVVGDNPEPTDKLEAAKNRFETMKTRRLHKSVQMFPTGIALQGAVGELISDRAKDEQCSKELQEAKVLASSLPGGQETGFAANYDKGIVSVANKSKLMKLRVFVAGLEAKGSKRWRDENDDGMEQIEQPLKKARQNMIQVVDGRLNNLMNKVLETFIVAMSGKQADVDHFEAQKDLCLADFPNLDKSFENLESPANIKQIATGYDERKQHINALCDAWPVLSGNSALDLASPSMIAVVGMATLPATSGAFLVSLPKFAEFSQKVQSSLVATLVSHVLKQIPAALLSTMIRVVTSPEESVGAEEFSKHVITLLSKFQALDDAQTGALIGLLSATQVIMASYTGISEIPIIPRACPDMTKEIAELVTKNKLTMRMLCETIQLTVLGRLVASAGKKLTTESVANDEVFDLAPHVEAAAAQLYAAVPENEGRSLAEQVRRLATTLKECYYSFASEAAEATMATAEDTWKALDILFEYDAVQYMSKTAENEVSDPEKQAHVLEMSKSEACQEVYTNFKALEGMTMMEAERFDPVAIKMKEELTQRLILIRAKHAKMFPEVKKIVAANTIAQSIFRPLKTGETRADLIARTKKVLAKRDLLASSPAPFRRRATASRQVRPRRVGAKVRRR
jgi:hypothetical protein